MSDLTIKKEKIFYSKNLFFVKGILILIWGIFALFNTLVGASLLIVTFGILNLLAALLTLLFIYPNLRFFRSLKWLLLEGLIELAAGILFTFFINDANSFFQYLSYGIIFIIILQFIYGYTLLLTGKFRAKNMLMRFATLIAGTLISISLMSKILDEATSFTLIGVFSVIYGLLNIQFSVKFKNVVLGKIE